jgi:hypothetical protein
MSNPAPSFRTFLAPNRLRWLSLSLALSWMATIYYLSSQSMPDIDLGFSGQDKVLHMAGYGLLGLLWLGALPRRAGGYSLWQVALATGIAALYGLSDEWHQSFVPGRSADILDVAADGLGGLLGALLGYLLSRGKRRT